MSKGESSKGKSQSGNIAVISGRALWTLSFTLGINREALEGFTQKSNVSDLCFKKISLAVTLRLPGIRWEAARLKVGNKPSER